MSVRRFEDLVVWQRAHELTVSVYRISGKGGFATDTDLRGQVRRAAVSIMSNVAEGFERYSRAEFRHFLSISRGSAAEVRNQLYLARSLTYLAPRDFDTLYLAANQVSHQLAALRATTVGPGK